LGAFGLIYYYIKKLKHDKEGLKGKFKIIGQIGLGIIVGLTLFFHSEVTIKDKIPSDMIASVSQATSQAIQFYPESKSTKTTIPFVKDNEFDYADLITWIHPSLESYAWIVFVLIAIFIIAAVSNGANLTDGIDGLAAGTSAIIALTLGIFAWVSGNIIFSDYLNIMYIPRVEEITIFLAAFVGALIGFFVVQYLSSPSLYGRYREFNHRRYYSRNCHCCTQRVVDSFVVWDLLNGKLICCIAS
jgi:phospho-N-acetylmuramoyl-pentapeptide-transferase